MGFFSRKFIPQDSYFLLIFFLVNILSQVLIGSQKHRERGIWGLIGGKIGERRAFRVTGGIPPGLFQHQPACGNIPDLGDGVESKQGCPSGNQAKIIGHCTQDAEFIADIELIFPDAGGTGSKESGRHFWSQWLDCK